MIQNIAEFGGATALGAVVGLSMGATSIGAICRGAQEISSITGFAFESLKSKHTDNIYDSCMYNLIESNHNLLILSVAVGVIAGVAIVTRKFTQNKDAVPQE